jgi:hypothetical protein
MMKIWIFMAFAAGLLSDAFKSPMTRRMSTRPLKMAVIDPDMPGQLAPLGYFDPLGLAEGTDEKIFKRWRESEVKILTFSYEVDFFLNEVKLISKSV